MLAVAVLVTQWQGKAANDPPVIQADSDSIRGNWRIIKIEMGRDSMVVCGVAETFAGASLLMNASVLLVRRADSTLIYQRSFQLCAERLKSIGHEWNALRDGTLDVKPRNANSFWPRS